MLEPIDTGVVAIGGTLPLTDGVMALAPHLLLDGPVMVDAAGPLAACLWQCGSVPAEADQTLARVLALRDRCPSDEDYLILGTRR